MDLKAYYGRWAVIARAEMRHHAIHIEGENLLSRFALDMLIQDIGYAEDKRLEVLREKGWSLGEFSSLAEIESEGR